MLPIRTVLCPVDVSENSVALDFAAGLARDYSARLVLLYVAIPALDASGEGLYVPHTDELFEAERKQLDELQISTPATVERRFEVGDAVTEILRVAEELDVDLIVMATHARTGLSRLLIGSVTEDVIRHAKCPVLTVSGRTPDPETRAASARRRTAQVDVVQEASEESFPASDAPAWTGEVRV